MTFQTPITVKEAIDAADQSKDLPPQSPNVIKALKDTESRYDLTERLWLEMCEADNVKDQLPRDLGIQCVDFLKQHSSKEDWKGYLRELESITCLDVLPHDKADLIPYGRII